MKPQGKRAQGSETSRLAVPPGSPYFDVESTLPYLYDAGTSIGNAFKSDLRRHDITLPMWRVLATLADRDDQTVTEIARRSGLAVYTTSRLVAAATEAGRVQRRTGRDARSLNLRLTREGRRLVERLTPRARDLERTALEGIEPAEAALLRDLLRRIAANVSAPRRLAEPAVTAVATVSASLASSPRTPTVRRRAIPR
jgi:DNA-binding MarR family transcriptional regulator